ncbi:hypothetical protein [Kitasatospora cineracea]|uniref:hypothetical protein n=1 Tax=Kitasatospora cineracea TaxID=88074 RepID=UPI0013C3483C|nr:hypothetical protein [Kitasatospora cineracea]
MSLDNALLTIHVLAAIVMLASLYLDWDRRTGSHRGARWQMLWAPVMTGPPSR